MAGRFSRIHGFVGRAWMAAPLSLFALVALSGCASDVRGDEDSSPRTEDELQRVGSSVLDTDKTTLRPLSGYNSLLDEGYAPCVDAAPGSGPALSVGNVTEKFEISYVSSRVQLAKELGIDLGLGVKYGPASGRVDFGFLNSYNQSNTSVSFLLNAKQTYTVSNLRAAKLTEDALSLFQNEPDAFVQRCGDGYVEGLVFSAQLSVLLRFDAPTEETARQIKVDLAGSGGATVAGQGAQIDANLKTKLVNNVRRAGVTANVVVASNGFLVSGNPHAAAQFVPLGNGITDETFTKIEQLRVAMGKSLLDDLCRDGLDGGNCSTGPAPGYERNRTRYAKPSSVLFAGYNRAVNAPVGGGSDNPYQRIQTKLRDAETYLRAFSNLQIKMENAYYNEIAPFLQATPEQRAVYNVAPPAKPLLKPQDVTATVEAWHAKFRPSDGLSMGAVVEQNYREANECWRNAVLGDYSVCLDGPADGKSAFRAAAAELEAYTNTGRVLPLRYAKGNRGTYQAAQNSCARVKDIVNARFPSSDEVARLAPVVASVARDGKVWYKDDAGRCDKQPYFENTFSSSASVEQSYKCYSPSFWSSQSLDAFCVPPNGAFGSILPL